MAIACSSLVGTLPPRLGCGGNWSITVRTPCVLLSTALVCVAGSAQIAAAQTIDPFYASRYTVSDLGSVPGVPPLYGGCALKFDDANTLLIGGDANDAPGALYSIGLVRDSDGHITGFSGTAMFYAEAAYNDGGVIYGPNNVLFLARWPVNEFGQIRAGSTVTDRIIDLTPFGVEDSVAAMNFVPQGYHGAGRLKFVSWPDGEWNNVVIALGANGLYDVISATEVVASRLPGGPEGFVYVPPASPLFPGEAMLVSEFTAGNVTAYDVDANGDPIVATARLFVDGLEGA